MKIYKYKHVPTAILSTVVFSLLSVLLSYSLSLLVVQNQQKLLHNFLIVFLYMHCIPSLYFGILDQSQKLKPICKTPLPNRLTFILQV